MTGFFGASGFGIGSANPWRKIDSSAATFSGAGSFSLIGGICWAPGFFASGTLIGSGGGDAALAVVVTMVAVGVGGAVGLPDNELQFGMAVLGGNFT